MPIAPKQLQLTERQRVALIALANREILALPQIAGLLGTTRPRAVAVMSQLTRRGYAVVTEWRRQRAWYVTRTGSAVAAQLRIDNQQQEG